MAQHFAKEEINCHKFAKYLQQFGKVAKFCQIWSHCRDENKTFKV